LIAVTDVVKESVWFKHLEPYPGSVKFWKTFIVIFVGEELTVFGFVKEEYEKSLRTTGLD